MLKPVLPDEFKQDAELHRIIVLGPHGLSVFNWYRIKSTSSFGKLGIISNVKFPAVAALNINQAEFCSFGPGTSMQLPDSGSSSLYPAPFKLETVIV